MKKAAIIAPNSLPVPPIRGGGIQNGIAEIIKHYKNYKPYVFSISKPGIDDLPTMETDGNIEHRRISLTDWEDFKIRFFHLSTDQYFPYCYLIAKQLKEIEPDIIHIRSRPWFVPLFRKMLGKDIPIILHNHNNYFMEMNRKQVKKHLDQINGFAGVSNFTVNMEVLNRFPEEKERCFTIYNGVNMEKFDPNNIKTDSIVKLKKNWNIKNEDIVVSYFGRLRKSKGISNLLEAVKILINKKYKNLKLMLIGSNFFGGDFSVSPFMKELEHSAKEVKDNIIFTGFISRDDIENIYALSDIVALPSLVQDASPNVCYEAQAMEKPLISTKRGGIPEIVKDGETALLLNDPESIDELAKNIEYLASYKDKRLSMGKKGRKRVSELFTWKHAAERTEQMYDKVLMVSK